MCLVSSALTGRLRDEDEDEEDDDDDFLGVLDGFGLAMDDSSMMLGESDSPCLIKIDGPL